MSMNHPVPTALVLAALLLAAAGLAACVEEPPVRSRFESPVAHACADRPFGETDRHDADADYGCATARNLAQMVANPADLDAPHDAAAPRGDAALAAAARHRVGQDKPLPATVGGGSSAGRSQ
jgi:type IV pilus biogenesis protein CpaD/CtpE